MMNAKPHTHLSPGISQMHGLADSILHSLAYYDVFSCPLTLQEIYHNLDVELESAEDLRAHADALRIKGLVREYQGYYVLANKDPELLVNRRLSGRRKALLFMPLARMIGWFIGLFPFVQAVFISGTMAKEYMDRHTDFDYFVITRPGHLWTAKMLLIAFKKVFLFNSYRFFCLNYFVDSDHLSIPDRNRFTAVELVTLIPVYNKPLANQFFTANQWVQSLLPNHPGSHRASDAMKQENPKNWIERLLSLWGSRLEQFSFRRFQQHIDKKYGDEEPYIRNHAFRSTPHVSKYHPNNYESQVLKGMKGKIKNVKNESP